MFPGIGTVVNVIAILVGCSLGVGVGHRLSRSTRDVVTDALGLVTLLIASLSAYEATSPVLADAVGDTAPILLIMGAMALGGIIGSVVGIERRMEQFAGWVQARLTRSDADEDRQRFIEGFVASSLLFVTGPLTILGSLSDGLGSGADQLFLKAGLDGFASMAFAASFGWGVAASALAVGFVQGMLTVVGAVMGQVVPEPHLVALTATGGLLLVGIGLRLLDVKRVPVADMLPALVLAPVFTQLVIAVR